MSKSKSKSKKKTKASTSDWSTRPLIVFGLGVVTGALITAAIVAVVMYWGGLADSGATASQNVSAGATAKTHSNARIALSPGVTELGRIGQSKKVDAVLTVTNTGSEDLLIEDVLTT